MSEPKITQELITPSRAREYLATAGPTYRFRRNHCDRIRADMQSGNFHPLYGHALVVDEEGSLHNGRHRLQAMVIEGKSYTFNVMHVDKEGAAKWDLVGDNAAAWTLSDHLRHQGVKDPFIVASALSYMWRYYDESILRQVQPTRTQAIGLLNSNPEIGSFSTLVRPVARHYRLSQGMCSAVAYLTATLPDVSVDDVTEFWSTLAGLGSTDPEVVAAVVSDLEHGNPLIALTNWLQKTIPGPRAGSSRRPENLTWALFIKAWNSYITSEPAFRLRWGRKEKFPALENGEGNSFPAGSPQLRSLLEN